MTWRSACIADAEMARESPAALAQDSQSAPPLRTEKWVSGPPLPQERHEETFGAKPFAASAFVSKMARTSLPSKAGLRSARIDWYKSTSISLSSLFSWQK